MVACSGYPVEFAKTIDQSEYFSQGVQSCFRFEQLSLARLMHKASFSIFGKIEFFSVPQALMVSLGGSLTENWVMCCPELSKVSNNGIVHLHVVLMVQRGTGVSGSNILSSLISVVLQAIATCKLDARTLPTLCQELIDEWKSVLCYLTTHAPLQEGQGTRNRVNFPVNHLY